METKVIRLHFTAPVHFGDGRLSDGLKTCDAATLFSAFFIEALRMGCADSLIKAVRSGDLLISDAFPYIGECYYLPKPMEKPVVETSFDLPTTGDSRTKKAFKKLEYIRVERMDAYLSGRMDPFSELELFKLGESSLTVRVNLERFEKPDAIPYAVGGYSFRPEAGLYFLACGSFSLDSILDSLQYSGIGGKRSSGYGRFYWDEGDSSYFAYALKVPGVGDVSSPTGYMLLSSAMPTNDELSEDLISTARYRIQRKAGYVQSQTHAETPQRKRDFYVFSAGSVFKRTFVGDVYDVNGTPGGHPVYRYARALWMGV